MIGITPILLGLLLFFVLVLALAGNTQIGRQFIETKIPQWSGGTVSLAGLSGRFPDSVRIGRIELNDDQGPWLVVGSLELDWSPSRLLIGTARIHRLEARHITVLRQPEYAQTTAPPGRSTMNLPVQVELSALQVERLELLEQFAGKSAAIAVDATAHLASLSQGDIDISLRRLDGDGSYRVEGRLESEAIHARLLALEPPQGLLSSYARLPGLGALSVEAALDGPRSAANLNLALAVGPLSASAQGVLDFVHESLEMAVSVSSPAMKPSPDLSWESLTLDAHASGPFAKPTAAGKLSMTVLRAYGAGFRAFGAEWDTDTAQAKLIAKLDGVRMPGPHPDLLQAAPLSFEAHTRLDAPERPVDFTLTHPLIAAQGRFQTLGIVGGEARLTLSNLTPFASLAGVDLAGESELNLRGSQRDGSTLLELDGKLAVTGGQAPLPALIGRASRFTVSVELKSQDIALKQLRFDGKALSLAADGGFAANLAKLNWKLELTDLATVTPTLSGPISAQGSLSGPSDNLAVTADLIGMLATKGTAAEPVTAKLRITGLPSSPLGRMTATGKLVGSPLELDLGLQSATDGAALFKIERADWKSAHASGTLAFPKAATLPIGKVELQFKRLEDLGPLLGEPLSGSLTAKVQTNRQSGGPEAFLDIDVRDAAWPGIAGIGHASLYTHVADTVSSPKLDGYLSLDGLAAKSVAGSARLDWAGTQQALTLGLSADSKGPGDMEARLSTYAVLHAHTRNLDLSSLRLTAKGETMNLLSPARIDFADGVILSPLRLGLRKGSVEMRGRLAPTLDVNLSLRDIPADLATLVSPNLDLEGALDLDGTMTGSPAQPIASVHFQADGIRQRKGPGNGLPPAQLTAAADLANRIARIDARLTAGSAMTLTAAGQAPITPQGSLDLRASGTMDLKMLDPLLGASGRQVRGAATLGANVRGTLTTPEINGSVQLAKGDFRDYPLGIHISDINALLESSGDSIRLAHLESRAGPGIITASGSVGVLQPGMPVNVNLNARNASPLSSDRLTINLNSNLGITGSALGAFKVAGAVRVNRAEINIPEHLPAHIAVLEVRNPNAPPPAPDTKPESNIGLDLKIDAPGEIFVRGRGLDAEVGGNIKLRGSTDKPKPEGNFQMRRGQLGLAGQTLSFSKGEVGFDGGTLTDPALNFVASKSSGNITATLQVTGTARKPKITLQSIPELPQDEILAQLLFANSSTNLSPLELAQIAAALASLTGITSGGGDPLAHVRKGLGLDRLSLGGGQAGPSLEAGRYVAPGVFVGAKQGLSTTNTQGAVQIDLTKRLKLEGTIGTGSPTTTSSGSGSVGVLYQYEY